MHMLRFMTRSLSGCVWELKVKCTNVISDYSSWELNFLTKSNNVLYRVKTTVFFINTGRFKMLSVITNIYNKKTKGPTLIELFTATGKLKKFVFYTTRDVRCVQHWWHGTHRYDLATHASTWVHRYLSLLQWSVPLGQRGHMAMLGRIHVRTLHEMHVAQ